MMEAAPLFAQCSAANRGGSFQPLLHRARKGTTLSGHLPETIAIGAQAKPLRPKKGRDPIRGRMDRASRYSPVQALKKGPHTASFSRNEDYRLLFTNMGLRPFSSRLISFASAHIKTPSPPKKRKLGIANNRIILPPLPLMSQDMYSKGYASIGKRPRSEAPHPQGGASRIGMNRDCLRPFTPP